MKRLLIFLLLPLALAAQTQHGRISSDQILNKSIIVVSGATPSVANGNVFKTNNGSATTVTNFLNGTDTQQIAILCGDSNTTIQNNANISIAGGSDFTCVANTGIAFVFDASQSKWIENGGTGTGGGGGGSPGTPTDSVQCNNGAGGFRNCNATEGSGTFTISENQSVTGNQTVSGNSSVTGTQTIGSTSTINGDTIRKGPNPWVDIRAYGARSACAASVAPCAPGVTATISSSSTSTTLSSASSFINGDGVVIYGAGAATTLSTPGAPTVTGSIAAAGTRTGFVVNAPVGATTYNYQILARDAAGGFTPAGSVGSTTTGPASLGAQSVAISGFTRATNIVTATTSSPHGLSIGAMVYITSTITSDNLYFGGWFVVASVPDTTHFTYATGNDVADGALATSAGGGTAHWFNCNHLTWTPVTGAFAYYIYGRTGGSLTLLGVTTPQTTIADASWDDFGATMMGGFVAPYFIPTTPPVSGQADPLVTTIVSGAGTTTPTLANAASTSVTNATILFDNTLAIQAAAASAGGSLLYIPGSTNGFVVNSYLTIPASVAMDFAGGTLILNDTMQIGSADKLFGMLGAQSHTSQQFSWPVGGFITVNKANFGVFNSNGGGMHFDGIQFTGTSNAQYLMVLDAPGGSGSQNHWHNVNFVDGGGSGDYMGVNLLIRGSFWNDLDHILFGTGPGQEGGGFNGTTATPGAIFSTGALNLSNLSVQDRGLLFIQGNSGSVHVTLTGVSRDQGGITPFLMTAFNAGGNAGGSIYMSGVELDTMSHAFFANLAGTSLGINLILQNMGTGPANSFGGITGKPVLLVQGSNGSGTNNASINAYNFTNNPVNVTGTGEFLYPIVVSGAPGISVTSGGNFPIGTFSYVITYTDVNGNESTSSAFTNFTTTSGNQTVNVTGGTAPAGAIGWKAYRCSANGISCTRPATIPCGKTFAFSDTWVDSFAFGCDSQGPPSINQAGSQTLSSVGLSGTGINIIGGGFKSTQSFTGTASRAIAWPDASGTPALINSPQTWSTNQTNMALITPSIGGETISSVPRGSYDAFLSGALTVTGTGQSWTLDKAITVTRVQAQLRVAPSACSVAPVIRISDGTNNINLTISAAANDSGAITQNFAAASVITISTSTAASGCTVSPGDANVQVQYKSQ